MDINIPEALVRAAICFPPFLFALCFHEYAHGWTARKFGDRTAELMGRLTMNPVSHMDMLGTVVLPIAGMMFGGLVFGWAKPVPVNERNLDKPKEQMFWIAFAGPLSNVIQGFIGALVLIAVSQWAPAVSSTKAIVSMLQFYLLINAVLAVFNMIPLHPLDGGKVLARFLPDEANRKLEALEPYSLFILIGFLVVGGFKILAIPIYGLNNLFLAFGSSIFSLLL